MSAVHGKTWLHRKSALSGQRPTALEGTEHPAFSGGLCLCTSTFYIHGIAWISVKVFLQHLNNKAVALSIMLCILEGTAMPLTSDMVSLFCLFHEPCWQRRPAVSDFIGLDSDHLIRTIQQRPACRSQSFPLAITTRIISLNNGWRLHSLLVRSAPSSGTWIPFYGADSAPGGFSWWWEITQQSGARSWKTAATQSVSHGRKSLAPFVWWSPHQVSPTFGCCRSAWNLWAPPAPPWTINNY